MTKNVVLFGGTFNPIHNGHLAPIFDVAQKIDADKLVYIPCHIPPHKALPTVDSQHRMAMTKIAVNEYNATLPLPLNVEVSDFELTQAEKSYTRNTIRHFQEQDPQSELSFIIGADSLLQFHTWHDWQGIVNNCHIYVIQRPGYGISSNLPKELQPYFKQNFHLIDSVTVNTSSTILRKQLGKDNDVSFIPNSVINYINQHKLYA